jgi:FtsP/CotA-like multicopper oxidase with cupredoxin domain
MSTADLLATPLDIFAEPGDFVTVTVTVPLEYQPGTWVATLWDSECQDVPTALFTVTPPSGTPVIIELDTTNPLLVPSWASSFSGYWNLKRTVSGETRVWVKGKFILDTSRRQAM